MSQKTLVSRREFLKDTAMAGAGAAVLGGLAPARVMGANDRIRVAVLGAGNRGQMVMKRFKRFSEVVAVCDVYGPRREEALKLADSGAKAYVDRDYPQDGVAIGRLDVEVHIIDAYDLAVVDVDDLLV